MQDEISTNPYKFITLYYNFYYLRVYVQPDDGYI